MSENRLCYGCMEVKGEQAVCPHCGYQDGTPYLPDYIAPGTMLRERYLIGVLLGHNGEGATYLAYDTVICCKVLIREYMPIGLCTRIKGKPIISVNYNNLAQYKALMAEYTELNKTLARMRNLSHINPTLDLFAENNTTYTVFEYTEGVKLLDFLKDNAGELSWNQAKKLFPPLFTTLSLVHNAGIVHRGISPETIYVTEKGNLQLSAFCISSVRTANTELKTELFPGYAAPEQYGGMGQTDERTDIYCLGVTLYSMLTGYSPEKPPYKIYHQQYWGENISCEIKEVILKCIQLEPDMRYQNCKELSYAFSQVDYKNHNFLKTEKRKVKKLIVFIVLLQISGMFSLGCKGAAHFYKEKAIAVYIESAEKSIDKKKAEQYYKQALLFIPDEKAIYQSLVKYFIHPNNFSVEDASILTSVVMTTCKDKAVLDIFKENKREGYMEFCYEVGLGYFYDMGGITGKSASEKWFCDVVDLLDDEKKKKTFDESKKKRVIAYANIARYYNTFLVNGVDKSGERENKDFLDFYNELCILNQFKITERSSTSDISAAYLISKEVAIEMANYADEFLKMKEINRKMLKKQLIKINGRMQYFERAKKNGKELENLLQDAQRRVEMADGFKYEGDEGDEGGI